MSLSPNSALRLFEPPLLGLLSQELFAELPPPEKSMILRHIWRAGKQARKRWTKVPQICPAKRQFKSAQKPLKTPKTLIKG